MPNLGAIEIIIALVGGLIGTAAVVMLVGNWLIRHFGTNKE